MAELGMINFKRRKNPREERKVEDWFIGPNYVVRGERHSVPLKFMNGRFQAFGLKHPYKLDLWPVSHSGRFIVSGVPATLQPVPRVLAVPERNGSVDLNTDVFVWNWDVERKKETPDLSPANQKLLRELRYAREQLKMSEEVHADVLRLLTSFTNQFKNRDDMSVALDLVERVKNKIMFFPKTKEDKQYES